jgi:HD-GYP domain-containing protein (c-di-GMP phosphodiesterase class II)
MVMASVLLSSIKRCPVPCEGGATMFSFPDEGNNFIIKSLADEPLQAASPGRVPLEMAPRSAVKSGNTQQGEAVTFEQNMGGAALQELEDDDRGSLMSNLRIFSKFNEYVDPDLFNADVFKESIKQAAQNATTSIWTLLKKVYDEDDASDDDLVDMLEAMMKVASSFTYEHSKRVMEWSASLAHEAGLDQNQIDDIRQGALFRDIGETAYFYDTMDEEDRGEIASFLKKEVLSWKASGELHDIGKLQIPPEIVNKTSRLTDEEYEIMKQHPLIGEAMLKPIKRLAPILPAVRNHHERWDGMGYPDGLSGESIPVAARIIAITDSFDAMTEDRPYRKAMSQAEATGELRKNAGVQFDSELVERFLGILQKDATLDLR